jgi:hypothetical protein
MTLKVLVTTLAFESEEPTLNCQDGTESIAERSNSVRSVDINGFIQHGTHIIYIYVYIVSMKSSLLFQWHQNIFV